MTADSLSGPYYALARASARNDQIFFLCADFRRHIGSLVDSHSAVRWPNLTACCEARPLPDLGVTAYR